MRTEHAQSLSVKRAQVEFHGFASFGEPDRVMEVYREENLRRTEFISRHREFIGCMTPFLEIGANAGHTSYLLENEYGARGFALDLSADSLRHGAALQEAWGYGNAPVRIAGDALDLPFEDSSLRLVLAFQMLSQFMDIESVFLEVKRVLAPGGVFLFAEEPLRRALSLRLYRAPYYRSMKRWEQALYRHGLLGYLVRDVIGAYQEESFGIRQNHTFALRHWHALIRSHFAAHEYQIYVPERGWGESLVKRAARRLDRYGSDWIGARLLGGTLAAVCRKSGETAVPAPTPFVGLLRCPDCRAQLRGDFRSALGCTSCSFTAPNEGGVYNLLGSSARAALYPGNGENIMDCSMPGHESRLGAGWHELEGVYGNRYRWMERRAEVRLRPAGSGPWRLRIRGFAPERSAGGAVRLRAVINGSVVRRWTHNRPGLFVFEADLPEAPEYAIELFAEPVWKAPGDRRELTVNLSMVRLIPSERE